MTEFFSKYFFGGPFEIFSIPHLAALCMVFLVNLLIYRNRGKFTKHGKKALRLTLASSLIIFQTAWVIWLIAIGEADLTSALPLHLCSLMVLVSALMLVANSYRLFEYTYFLGSGGALAALFMPDLGMYGFPHFLFFQTFIVHGCLITAQVSMVAVEGYIPTVRSLLKSIVAINLYLLLIAGVNRILGSNYLFISSKPNSPTILDYLSSPPWYYLEVELIILTVLFLLYLPFFLNQHIKRKALPERI